MRACGRCKGRVVGVEEGELDGGGLLRVRIDGAVRRAQSRERLRQVQPEGL